MDQALRKLYQKGDEQGTLADHPSPQGCASPERLRHAWFVEQIEQRTHFQDRAQAIGNW